MISTVGRACLEGRSPSLLGKDEVASSNLASSSKKEPIPSGIGSFFMRLTDLNNEIKQFGELFGSTSSKTG